MLENLCDDLLPQFCRSLLVVWGYGARKGRASLGELGPYVAHAVAILAQGHFCLNTTLLARVVSVLCNYRFPVFCVPVSRAMVRKGWKFDGRSQRVAEVFRAETDDWEVVEPSESRSQSAHDAPSGRVGPAAAQDLAKNKIVQLERALEAMGGMEGPCSPSHQVGEGQNSFQEASVERGDRGGPKVHHSFHATSEGVEERLLSEKGPSHPAPSWDATSQITDFQQMVNMLQAERDSLVAELQSRGRIRRVEKLHLPQSSEKAAKNLRERAAKRQACGPEDIPNSEQELTNSMCTKHLELRDALEIGPNELVVEISQLLANGALAMQAFSVVT